MDTNKIKAYNVEYQTSNKLPQQPDRIPAYPGGEMKLFQFIAENLDYPREALKDKIQGRVLLRFVVTETGIIDSIMVYKGIRQDLDNAAIKLIKKMPDWIPGIKNGKTTRMWCSLPITFRYQK